MHIVHVEDFFHPDAGYQVNLLARLQVADGHQCTVVTADLDGIPAQLSAFFGSDNMAERDARFERETGVSIMRLPLVGYYSGRAIFNPWTLFHTVDELAPDVAFVHGEDTLTGMLFIWRAERLKYPMILDCHMLEMASENKFREQFRAFYRRFVTPVIRKNRIPLIRVVDSDFVEKCLGIPLQETELLSFGTDTVHFSPSPEARKQMRADLGLRQDAFVVLYAGKLDKGKGGKFLADALLHKLQVTHVPVEVLVIGNTDGEYGREVEDAFSHSENRLMRLPTQRYFDLAKYYQAADVAVFPKQCSMSFFEAQSCGLPVIFEENEVNSQRASAGNAFTFAPGNIEDFRAKIEWLGSLGKEERSLISRNARAYVLTHYDYVPIARRFTEVLQRAVSDRLKQRSAQPVAG